jgi:hypothetical protein
MSEKELNQFGTDMLIKALKQSSEKTQKEVINNWKRLKSED